jgi:hypothetical protein
VTETDSELVFAGDKTTFPDATDEQIAAHAITYRMSIGRQPGDRLDEDNVLACQRVPVRQVIHLLPGKYLRALEQNQNIKSCCRHPENHTIDARYTSPKQAATGVPDIIVFYCACGCIHRRPMFGTGDVRPKWDVR